MDSHSVWVNEIRRMGIPIRRLIRLMVRPTALLRMRVLHMVVCRTVVLRTGVLRMAMLPTVRRPIRIPDYLRSAKNARISSASSFGSSIAAKWPPRGITVHR